MEGRSCGGGESPLSSAQGSRMGMVLDLAHGWEPLAGIWATLSLQQGGKGFSCHGNILGFGIFFCHWAQPSLTEVSVNPQLLA